MYTLLFAIACRPEPDRPPPADAGATEGASLTAPLAPLDADGDGHAVDVDCDDGDPKVHPGALERCNDRDDSCDGGTDDGAVSVIGGEAYPTLQAALAAAPAHSEVRVCPGVYVGPFTVPRALIVSSSEGPLATALDGAGDSRVLAIQADGVEVRGFAVTRGFASYEGEGGGGGVYVARDVDATLTDVQITANTTDGTGGGLLLDVGASLVLDGVVSDCSAVDGAGAWLRENAVLTGGLIERNSALIGGGVGLERGASLVGVDVAANFAAAGGGGIYASGGEIHLVDSTVRENTSGWQGGGVSIELGTLWLDGSTTLSGNIATRAGGGIDLLRSFVVGGVVKGNHADELGGGIYATGAQISGTIIEGNDAHRGGGVATDLGNVELVDVSLTSNVGVLGGGLYVGAVATVWRSALLENQATSGGAAYVAGRGSIALNDTDLGEGQGDNAPDDIAGENGGGVDALSADANCDAYGCW